MARVLNVRGDGVPNDAVYIGRRMPRFGLAASKWANPFKIDRDTTREEIIVQYREYLLGKPELIAALPELRGKDLVCWCAPEPCHGDVLVELANYDPPIPPPAA
jgi:hypothetical protein